jgi:hypothetical protein
MAKKILTGQKELARMSAMEKVKEGNMTLTEEAAVLCASCRQAKRIRRQSDSQSPLGQFA